MKELTGLSCDCIGVGRAIHACSEVWQRPCLRERAFSPSVKNSRYYIYRLIIQHKPRRALFLASGMPFVILRRSDACMAIICIPGAFYAARDSTFHAEAGTRLDVQTISQR